MLIFDEQAEGKLIKTLETLRSTPSTNLSRALHFKLSQYPATAIDIRPVIIAAVKNHLPQTSPHMYVCDDGDIIMLMPTVPSKEAKQVMLDVATAVGLPATDALVEFHELSLQINRLLTFIEQKVEKHRQAAEAARKQREAQLVERKRESILNYLTSSQKTDAIAAQRKVRGKPELMIIEDDVFSCRLVENVLQKRYLLTSFNSAEGALAAYAELAPDILFLDINLPDVTGHELLEKIIALDPQAYVIMLSGNADKDNIMQAMKLGAKGFIAKPFSREKLFQYIDRCPTIIAKESKCL